MQILSYDLLLYTVHGFAHYQHEFHFIVLYTAHELKCDAIRWEQFWQRCRLGQR